MKQLTLIDRKIIVFFKDSLGGREFNHCSNIQLNDDNSVSLTYDYRSPDKFGATSYTTIILHNVDEIKIY